MPYKTRRFRDCSLLQENGKQEFIVDQFKPLILKAGGLLNEVLPNLETDVYFRNRDTESLIKLRDKYFRCEKLEHIRSDAFRGVWNLGILIMKYNYCYAQRGRWIARELSAMEWHTELPDRNWEEIEA